MASERNDRLAAALRLAGISNKELARQLNTRAKAAGLNMAVDASRVGRWINAGERPRDPVPGLLAVLLRERTGQALTLADIGLSHGGTDPFDPSWGPDRLLASLHEYARSDALFNRRDLMKLAVGGPLVATAERLWWMDSVARGETTSGKLGLADVTGIDSLVAKFRSLDATHGGALFRQAVVAQLETTVQLLQDGQRPTVTQRLRQAAVDLAQLAGWTSHDAGRYATAQRYWAHAVSLARQADDPGRGAEVISRMSHQMVYLGRPDDALALLDVATRAAGKTGDFRLRAMLAAQSGRMHAALGDAQRSRMLLGQAQEHLHKAEEAKEQVAPYIAYFNHAELAGATAVSHRDLKTLHGKSTEPASVYFGQAIERRPAGYDRVRAMDAVGQAAALLDEGEPEQACTVAGQALTLAEQLESTLIKSRVKTLVDASGRFGDHPQLADLRERVTAWGGDPDLLAA
ncbi:hypothetical protein [Streptomyces natalensis]|uniref:Transcriptional regulator n=1 Tax=Streptomyces natalensis ATCC 27448 TaxID=1240678 RepID=A0A0D7CHC3_9ACTN|nr:hypothetical protein [Streptomyces natalensis]KIZ15674.1 hypothetical protein SNA_25365 [Streptomyces natalensis ATCC 27448]